MAYIGWAAYASISLLPPTSPLSATTTRVVDAMTIVTLLSFWMVFWMQKSPWTLYVYVAFPCYFWREFCVRGMLAFRQAVRQSSLTYSKAYGQGILIVLALQGMVVCSIYLLSSVSVLSQAHAGSLHSSIDMECWFRCDWCLVATVYMDNFYAFSKLEACCMLESELHRY